MGIIGVAGALPVLAVMFDLADRLPKTVPTVPAVAVLVVSIALNVGLLLDRSRRQQPPTAISAKDEVAPFVCDVIDTQWAFRRSDSSDGWWAATYQCRLAVRANVAGVLKHTLVDFTRGDERLASFTAENAPLVEMVRFARSGDGDYEIMPPHQSVGATYAFHVRYVPPLREGETADFALKIDFPVYRRAFREDLLAATTGSALGPRDYDYSARRVNYPTGRFDMSVFIPDELAAEPIGPVALSDKTTIDAMETEALSRSSSVARAVVDGVPGWLMSFGRVDPPLKMRYQIRWRPPERLSRSTSLET